MSAEGGKRQAAEEHEALATAPPWFPPPSSGSSKVLRLLDRAGLREPVEELAGWVLVALDTPPPPPVEPSPAALASGDDPPPAALTESFRERFGEALTTSYFNPRQVGRSAPWCVTTRTLTPWSGEAYRWLRREARDWLAENSVTLADPAADKGLDSSDTPAGRRGRARPGGVDSDEGRDR